jgi:hypothetical protein
MPFYIVMKYRNGKVPEQIKPTDETGPTFPELDAALRAALETSKAELDALVLVETNNGRIEAAFIWGDRQLPHLAK